MTEIKLEERPLYGWESVLVLSNEKLRLHITKEVGPRIIHCGPTDDQNLFYVDPSQLGKSGGEKWRLYGGHRLWHAPEHKVRTYAPDNETVPHTWDGRRLTLSPKREELTGLRKTLRIEMHPSKPTVKVVHRLTNDGVWDVTCSAWALTVLKGGGYAVLPNEPLGTFPKDLLPARPLVLWPYTRLTDARLRFHKEHMEVRHTTNEGQPVKIGIRNSQNWGAYINQGFCFLKEAELEHQATYPDFNSNWEVYTDSNMLELETLSPVTKLEPGNSVEHAETWHLLPCNEGDDVWKILQSRPQKG